MLEQRPNPEPGNAHNGANGRRQRGKLWLAIVLLAAALGLVLIKDHQFWFSSDDGNVDDETSTAADQNKTPSQHPGAAADKIKNHPSAKSSYEGAVVVPPAMIETQRVIVPPLNVQIVDGNKKRVLPAGGSNALQVQIPANSGEWRNWPATELAANFPPAVNAAEHARIPVEGPDTEQGPGGASTPLLTKQMKVRGSVVLQALVSAEGKIVDLRVLSGPEVLAPVAREAIRQWRFKPYIQNGRPVESQAKITVSFLISAS